jgi:hypothetical protein
MPRIENVSNVSERAPEVKVEAGQEEIQQSDLSPEAQLKKLEGETRAQEEEIAKLTDSVEKTKTGIEKIREELGMLPSKEEPPSISSTKDRLEQLKAEQEDLEKQREELESQQEKERLVREEKEKIFQEKLDELFKEFEALNPRDFESIFTSGKTLEGRNIESKSMGSLEPEIAQSLAKAFKEGIKLLPKILEDLPELLKKFDKDLTKEATERVERQLEEEKKKTEEKTEEPKLEATPKVLEGTVPPAEIKPETNPVESADTAT